MQGFLINFLSFLFVLSVQADTIYHLPFPDNIDVRVSQSCKGQFSHKNNSAYAIDFALPKKTPVLATRGGIVIKVKDSSYLGGPSEKYRNHANYIIIKHDDDTTSEYFHLYPKSAKVKAGNYVKAREQIALSGNTGYTTAPHLHFAVSLFSDNRRRTLPVFFEYNTQRISCPPKGTILDASLT